MPGPNDTFTLHAPLYGLPRPQELCLAQDASMQSTPDAIDASTDALRLEALALGALRNATLPINQLPNELFVEILLMTCSNQTPCPQGLQYPEQGEPRLIGTSHWVRLMPVCRHWCAVARATPGLWRKVDVFKNLDWLKLCIDRSSDATIELSFHSGGVALLAIPLLISLADRISSVMFPDIYEDDFAPVLSLFNRCMPRLEEIGVGVARMYDADATDATDVGDAHFDLSSARVPSLRILHLYGVAMPWTSAVVSRLTLLEVFDCSPDGPRIGISTFLDVLASCTQLAELQLHTFLCEALVDESSIPDRVIELPRLRRLVLRDNSIYLARLLSCIAIPLHVDASLISAINWQSPNGLEPSSFHALLPRDRHNIPIFTSAGHAEFTCGGFDMKCVARPTQASETAGISVISEHETDLISDTLARNFSNGLSEFIELFAGSPVQTLHLSGYIGRTTQLLWERVFGQFPSLETLVIHAHGHTPLLDIIFSALASTRSPNESLVVCPQLRELNITTQKFLSSEEVKLCLRTRASLGARALHKLRLSLPASDFDKGRLKWKSHLEELLVDLLPEGGLIYEKLYA